jgi:hypothetical protein
MTSSFVPLRKFVWGFKPPSSEPTSLYAFLKCSSLIFSLCSYLFEFLSCFYIFYGVFSEVSHILVFCIHLQITLYYLVLVGILLHVPFPLLLLLTVSILHLHELVLPLLVLLDLFKLLS